jgi:hypothetical protein
VLHLIIGMPPVRVPLLRVNIVVCPTFPRYKF